MGGLKGSPILLIENFFEGFGMYAHGYVSLLQVPQSEKTKNPLFYGILSCKYKNLKQSWKNGRYMKETEAAEKNKCSKNSVQILTDMI